MYTEPTCIKEGQNCLTPDDDTQQIVLVTPASISALDCAPNDNHIAYDQQNVIRIYDYQQDKHLTDLVGSQHVKQIKYSPNAHYLASGSYQTRYGIRANIDIWDTRTLRKMKQLKGHKSTIQQIGFSSNNFYLISCSWDDTLKFWYLKKGKLVRKITQFGGISSLDYSPICGNIIFAVDSDYSLIIMDVQNVQKIREIKGHINSVVSIKYSYDGQLIISAGFDKTVRIWNSSTGQQVGQNMIGHEGLIYQIAISPPDSEFIISGSEDGTVRLWKTNACKLIRIINYGDQAYITFVRFTNCGKFILSAYCGRYQTLRITPLERVLAEI